MLLLQKYYYSGIYIVTHLLAFKIIDNLIHDGKKCLYLFYNTHAHIASLLNKLCKQKKTLKIDKLNTFLLHNIYKYKFTIQQLKMLNC